MFRMSETVSINRAPTDVFDFVSDLNNFQHWRANLASSTVKSERSNGAGAWCEEEIQAGRRRIPGTCSITALTAGQEFTFRAISAGLVYEGRLLVEPEGGSTRLTLGGVVHISGGLRLIEPMLRRRMRSGLRSEVKKIKRLLDANTDSGT